MPTGKPFRRRSINSPTSPVNSDIPAGNYSLTIGYTGYTTLQQTQLPITPAGKTLDLGTLSLSVQTRTLEQAVVTASRPPLENKMDRIVYNVDRDVT